LSFFPFSQKNYFSAFSHREFQKYLQWHGEEKEEINLGGMNGEVGKLVRSADVQCGG
jgi:hypothetical protein